MFFRLLHGLQLKFPVPARLYIAITASYDLLANIYYPKGYKKCFAKHSFLGHYKN